MVDFNDKDWREVVSSERAPQKDKTVILKKKISGQMSQIWAWHQDILTDCQLQCDFEFDFD
jgi:hypothetical protein